MIFMGRGIGGDRRAENDRGADGGRNKYNVDRLINDNGPPAREDEIRGGQHDRDLIIP